jgi:carbamoyltransferase
MYILGISCFYHDSAVALLRDGELVAAAMEERFSRKKHDNGFPALAIDFCLRKAGITADMLDYVVFYEKPFVKFERILLTALGTYPRSRDVWREAMYDWLPEKLWVKTRLQNHLRIDADKVLFCDHHMSHAASAFYASPFDEAAVMTVDGVGEWTTTTLGRATANWDGKGENKITLFEEERFPHSVGLLYSAFTAFLGFQVNEGEYKVMGMAPYGQPRFVDKIHKLIEIGSDGSFRLNMDYFAFHHSATQTYNRRFNDLFGEERAPSDDFFTMATNPERSTEQKAMAANQYYADVAASIQAVTEEILLKMACKLYQETGLKKLVMAGGVALNSVANFKILEQTPFEEIYIQPAAGDDGGALGAALWVYHSVLKQPRKMVMKDCYWGEEYSEEQIRGFLEKSGIRYTYEPDDTKLIGQVVDSLTQGQVVGWFQGRFEWGPRALGNRSILADPRRNEMKHIVNTKIKYREPFRPFAPVVLAERVTEFFEYPEAASHYPPRFMLMVAPVKSEKQAVIPATTHEGGTGRLQTIDRETNRRYYDVIKTFGEATGVPVLLNTSFNLRGEPIVSTPANAWNTFSKSGLDMLVLGSFMVRK